MRSQSSKDTNKSNKDAVCYTHTYVCISDVERSVQGWLLHLWSVGSEVCGECLKVSVWVNVCVLVSARSACVRSACVRSACVSVCEEYMCECV